MTTAPAQFTTADGTLTGLVNNVNQTYTFIPYPLELFYSVSNACGSLFFRNGLLQDPGIDYQEEPGWYLLGRPVNGDMLTGEVFQDGLPAGAAPTWMRLLDLGLRANGTQALRITPQALSPADSTIPPFLLFRNGQLLDGRGVLVIQPQGVAALPNATLPDGGAPGFAPPYHLYVVGGDYTVVGPFIVLTALQSIQPGDTYTAVLGIGGVTVPLIGNVDGVNTVFTLPFPAATMMLFRNGILLTQGVDYVRQAAGSLQITFLPPQVPGPGDILLAQLYATGGPVQVSTNDGTLYGTPSVLSLLFRNGLLMTQPVDGVTSGNTAQFVAAETPRVGDSVMVTAWAQDALDPVSLPFNLPAQVSTLDGSLAGVINGINNVYVPVTSLVVTQVQLFWNGDFQTQGADYTWTCTQTVGFGPYVTTITMLGTPLPRLNDFLTAQVYTQ